METIVVETERIIKNPKTFRPLVIGKHESGCWLVLSHKARDADGYPVMGINRETKKIGRLIYKKYRGEFDENLMMCHHCDNPACVNPDHLTMGTNAKNCKDRGERGRTAVGSKIAAAKLKEEDVTKIRMMIKDGVSIKRIADIFSISASNISRIKRRKTWRHVP